MINTTPISILLVDDDPEEHVILHKILQAIPDAHYVLNCVDNYEAGLAEILSNKYDVCFIDNRLGSENGLDLLHVTAKADCSSSLILLTGQGNHETDLAAMQAGAMDYLNKNEATPQLLERTIRYAIERKKYENQLKKANQQLQYLSEYDLLTGLANRNQFNKAFPIIAERCVRNKQSIVVMFMDLDQFKEVNDLLGHQQGDLLLQQVAERLRQNLRKIDSIFRLGGDEFLIIMENLADTVQISDVAQKIIDFIAQPFKLHGHTASISASIGITTANSNKVIIPEQLLREADRAMYYAKKKGRNNFQFYNH